MQHIIEKTQTYLKEHLSESVYPKHEVDYRFEHSLRVANIGLKLAEMENANKKVVVLGCLLHDLGKFDTTVGIEHGRVSAKVARPFLEQFELSQKEIDDICYSIATHVDGKSGYEYEDILEAKIVTDADNIDRFSSTKMQMSRIWELDMPYMTVEERINDMESRLEKQRSLLTVDRLETASGNKLYKKKLEMQIYFNQHLVDDLKLTNVPKWDELLTTDRL